MFYFYILFLLANAGFAWVVANLAKEKGLNPVLFGLLSFFVSFPIGLLVVSLVQRKSMVEPEADNESKIILKNNFVGKYLLFIFLYFMFANSFTGILMTGISGTIIERFDRVVMQMAPYVVVALAVVVSSRSKGLDLSIPATLGFAGMFLGVLAQSIGLVASAVVVLFLCAVIGIIHGLLIVYVRVPAVLLTLITGTFIGLFGKIALQGQAIRVPMNDLVKSPLFFLAIIVVVLGAVMLLMMTNIGKPARTRTEQESSSFIHVAAYMATSMIAGVAGIIYAFRLQASSPLMDSGWLIFILIYFVVISATRLSQKRFVAPLLAVATAFFLALYSNVMSIMGYDIFIQDITIGFSAITFIVIMTIARKKEYRYSLDSI